MGVEEYRDALNEIFLKSGIVVFSEVQVKGFRFTQNQLANDAAPLFSDDDSSALVAGPSGAAALATPKNLLLLAAAAGIGYVLFLRN